MEVEERVEEVIRQGQKELQETKTKHKRELAKVNMHLQMIFFDFFFLTPSLPIATKAKRPQ